MSNEPIRNHDAGAHGSFEHQDLGSRGIIYSLIGLIVFLAVIYVIVFGVYHVLDSYNHANQATMSPMVAPEADTRNMGEKDTKAFPEPRLEESERTELRVFIENEDRRLATYNWLDKDKGVVQIPIDRAMYLIEQRGLPVRSQTNGQEQQQEQKEGSSAQ